MWWTVLETTRVVGVYSLAACASIGLLVHRRRGSCRARRPFLRLCIGSVGFLRRGFWLLQTPARRFLAVFCSVSVFSVVPPTTRASSATTESSCGAGPAQQRAHRISTAMHCLQHYCPAAAAIHAVPLLTNLTTLGAT